MGEAAGLLLAGGSCFHLTKLRPEDDIEAFLFTFERTATVANWLQAQLVTSWGHTSLALFR